MAHEVCDVLLAVELFAGARRRLGRFDVQRRSLHRRPGLSEHRPAQAGIFASKSVEKRYGPTR
jgi:hypothetical protein